MHECMENAKIVCHFFLLAQKKLREIELKCHLARVFTVHTHQLFLCELFQLKSQANISRMHALQHWQTFLLCSFSSSDFLFTFLNEPFNAQSQWIESESQTQTHQTVILCDWIYTHKYIYMYYLSIVVSFVEFVCQKCRLHLTTQQHYVLLVKISQNPKWNEWFFCKEKWRKKNRNHTHSLLLWLLDSGGGGGTAAAAAASAASATTVVRTNANVYRCNTRML